MPRNVVGTADGETMTIMITEVYDALVEAGASDEKARKAAEAIAGYDRHFERIDGRLNTLLWMVGANLTIMMLLCGGVIWKLMDLSEKVGGLTEAVARLMA